MELYLATYDPLLPYFNELSEGVSTEDYYTEIRKSKTETLLDLDRLEYSRLFEQIEFLIRHWDPTEIEDPLLVVQDRMTLRHYDLLSQMFPTLTIHIWGQSVFLESKPITTYSEDLSEATCTSSYAGENVFFFCYPDGDIEYQTSLLRAMRPKESNIAFFISQRDELDFRQSRNIALLELPSEANSFEYYRGYLTPRFLSSEKDDPEDQSCRCVPIKENDLLVRCQYSSSWFRDVLNYWNLAAKRGNLLRNPIDNAGVTRTTGGVIYFGVELCRVFEVLRAYLAFSQQLENEANEIVTMAQVLELFEALDVRMDSLGIKYSLAKHSNRYRPEGMIDEPVVASEVHIARPKVTQSEALIRAQNLLLLPEETMTELIL